MFDMTYKCLMEEFHQIVFRDGKKEKDAVGAVCMYVYMPEIEIMHDDVFNLHRRIDGHSFSYHRNLLSN